MQNAFEVNYDIEDPTKVVALWSTWERGSRTINILTRSGMTVFWRDISFGGNQFTEALQREFNLSFEMAERLKKGEEVGGFTPNDARPVLDAISTEMAAEIRKTFDFFDSTSAEGPIDELMLAGGCALTPNLREVLRERFGAPTELMDPFRRISYLDSGADPEWLDSIAPMLAVAVGLGVRKVGD